MVKKIVYFVAWILFPVFGVFSQKSPGDIHPFISSQEDVIKKLGEGSSDGTNRVTYNVNDRDVIITYYKSGCSASEEKQLKILQNTVLEVRVVLKAPQKLRDVITNLDLYKREPLPDNYFLYFDLQNGILVKGKREDLLEYVEKIYFLPPNSKIFECIVDSFDEASGLALLNYSGILSIKGDRFDFPPMVVGSYFEEDSNASKNDMLNEFSNKLLKRQNSFGLVMIYSGKSDKPSSVLQRRKKLLNLLKIKGITCQKIIFANGGVSELAGVYLAIVHKTFVLKNEWKPGCN